MWILDRARGAKHAAFVLGKRGRRRWRAAKFDVATAVFRDADRFRAFRFDLARYPGSFVTRDVVPAGPMCAPRRVFVVWSGDNELPPNRVRNLQTIRSRIGVPVELVTPDTLAAWLVDGHPLHPAYEHLSLIHRSDYLRGYLMHHHGGGYADIKEPVGSWSDSFDRMAADADCWVTSYSTSHANWVGKLRGRLGRDILIHYRLMFGKSGFMMRSHTPITAEWMAEMDRRLDAVADELAHHPGGVFGADGYPLSWTDLLGRVLDPLTLKYHAHVRYDEAMLLDFTDYR